MTEVIVRHSVATSPTVATWYVVGMTMGWWGWCCGVVVVWGGVVVVQLGCSVDVCRLVATLPNGDVAPS